MQTERSLAVHYVLRAAIMGGFCAYIVYLVQNDRLVYYIAPRMHLYVKLAALALFAIAIHQAYMAFRSVFDKPESCDCNHEPPRSFLGNIVVYGLFLVPLALGFLLPDQLMGSRVVSMKGMNLTTAEAGKPNVPVQTTAGVKADNTQAAGASESSLSAGAGQAASTTGSSTNSASTDRQASADVPLDELFKSDGFNDGYTKLAKKLYKQDVIALPEKGFMEILTTIDMFLDPFLGKQIEISGFVYREEGMKPNQFVVSRLAMQCCSADASPYGILVESPSAASFPVDTWVRISGTLGKTKYDDYDYMLLNAKQIEKIQPPKTPYVYPDYDYLDQA
ncbi:TIGR03943 family putative permease subunit [Paenibacillus ginsengarvi]|uniref:TIGR03943 family protein n=1 Tax=Paenibacillus ginsengarvi TaxID=400777 RepID=A0A3B0CHR6_9BACL|nr:TIGR03943 family protein [Paenibacillus ginsengarvi]RKN84421.1 TIGR03943 family protein [Paenibacillus ginsengarvi]